jgi:hypothetical protein
VITGGPTAITVIIGGQPAWRGVNPAVAAAMQAAKAIAESWHEDEAAFRKLREKYLLY